MREPERIEALLEKLKIAWHKYPDLRLGQIIVNATAPQNEVPEIFYIEDEALLKNIEKLLLSI